MAKIVELTNQKSFTLSLSTTDMQDYFFVKPENDELYLIVDYANKVGVYQMSDTGDAFTLIRDVAKTVSFTMSDCIYYGIMGSAVAIGQDSSGNTRMARFSMTGTTDMITIDVPTVGKQYTKLAVINNRLIAVGDSVIVADPPYLFSFTDQTASDEQDYEYALVPVVGEVEGGYLTVSATSTFDGVFLTDGTDIYKFYADVAYGNFQQTQKVNAHEPFGRKYPVIVSNAATNYMAGSMSGMVLAGDYLKIGKIDRRAIAAERDTLLKFLTNKKPKILKDWNGNIWMVAIVDNPSVTYYDGSGMGLMNVSMTFMEVGDATNANDLAANGFAVPEGS